MRIIICLIVQVYVVWWWLLYGISLILKQRVGDQCEKRICIIAT